MATWTSHGPGDGAEDTNERVMTSHTEGCEVTSVEEGHDFEHCAE